MSKELKIFEETEVRIIELNGEPYFELYSVGLALGQVKKNTVNGKTYVQCRKDRVDKNAEDAGIEPLVRDGLKYINESQLYDLMLEVKTNKVKPFRKWLTKDVLPTIRKTGGYVNNDDLFINTYLPYADDQTTLMFKTTLETVRKQNELIKKQQDEIEHKEDVIIGLVDTITLAEKRQILSRVVRYNHANYSERWSVLYREFENKYHINLKQRYEKYNETHKPKCKSKVDYIDKVMDKIPELYEIAAKLFEADVKALVDELYRIAS